MELEEAMKEIFYHGFVFTMHPKKALEALKVIRKVLLDYKQIKSDYIDLDNRLRTANTENDELKRLLVEAMDDLYQVPCDGICSNCPLDKDCKWQYHDEAMKLLGGTENAED